VQVPLDRDLKAVVDLLRSETADDPRSEVLVTSLEDGATLTLRIWAPNATAAERVASDVRVRAQARLRAEGVL
jgi:small-conductance mechanosensitive channel